ncbi:MAG: GNAT family N-acetyltransferase [Proteobacteria bacterium]|nr:MAG: GNAT family N-acetyltransferase [Pseudomonadota bacterium]
MALLGLEKEMILADGTRCLLRDVGFGDEAQIFRLEEATAKDALLQGEDPDPVSLPVAERAQWIRAVRQGEAWLAIAAEVDGRIVGLLEFRSHEYPQLSRHVGRFFISIEEGFRDRGIGRAAIQLMLDWCRANPRIEKITLSVLSSNGRAIALYEELGFREEGRKWKEFKLPDGTYADDILLAIPV